MLVDRQTDRHTDRQTDRNTPLPYRGGVTMSLYREFVVSCTAVVVSGNNLTMYDLLHALQNSINSSSSSSSAMTSLSDEGINENVTSSMEVATGSRAKQQLRIGLIGVLLSQLSSSDDVLRKSSSSSSSLVSKSVLSRFIQQVGTHMFTSASQYR